MASSSSGKQKETKRVKRECSFWTEREKDFEWLGPQRDKSSAYCTVCSKWFGIAHGGLSDMRQHAATQQHQANKKSWIVDKTRGIKSFFIQKNSSESEKVRFFTSHKSPPDQLLHGLFSNPDSSQTRTILKPGLFSNPDYSQTRTILKPGLFSNPDYSHQISSRTVLTKDNSRLSGGCMKGGNCLGRGVLGRMQGPGWEYSESQGEDFLEEIFPG
ncbi:hypothetical protein HOLleu_22893 [Holothuria leucospilota]|uniref:Uncharacterized protein n=1 Tax=Holothuria leucospilota TaxID=206669 RepID=A0A9Q1BU24_HOLLE|nr:hypothetical protein HOLleu_22893 [Holothuria leucospilota]